MDDRLTDDQVQRMKGTVLAAYRQTQSGSAPRAVSRPPMEEGVYGTKRSLLNKLILKPMIPIIIAIALVLSGAGTAFAADQAKPGDALYPLDRAIERVTYNFAISDTAKANMLTKFAAERENEQTALVAEGRTEDARQAAEDTKQALENAITVIDRVQAKHEENNQTQAAQTLTNVEEKLQEIQNRFTERQREEVKNKVKNALGEVKIEATTTNGQTVVNLKYNGQEVHYTLDTTDINAIIASIQDRTGMNADDIKTLLKLQSEDTNTSDETEDTATNSASINANTNGSSDNENQNKNLNYEHNSNNNYTYNGNVNQDGGSDDHPGNDNASQGEQRQEQNQNESDD